MSLPPFLLCPRALPQGVRQQAACHGFPQFAGAVLSFARDSPRDKTIRAYQRGSLRRDPIGGGESSVRIAQILPNAISIDRHGGAADFGGGSHPALAVSSRE